ncbi:MAG: hypothetical protein IT386_00630 [Deltaproteobacteria bacterium]|nr:hypothetical protein [Deltaproteobacteria bacterium]
MSESPHSAASSALGYLYQTQWPLLELLRRGRDRPDAALTLELHDDVAWEEGTPTELIQSKHHENTARSLGDKHADWWRTIRAWMNAHEPGDPDGPTLTMVTTLTAASGTAAAALRPDAHDPESARVLLESAATTSEEQQFATVRQGFLDLSDESRAIFVSRMYVLDASPTIGDLDASVRQEIGRGLPRDPAKADSYMAALWYWWHERAVGMLRRERRSVSALEIDIFLDDLRDSFGKDRLPTLVPSSAVNVDAVQAEYGNYPFAHQLRWVEVPAKILQKSIVDYYRAYTQQAAWIDADLIGLHRIEEFERDLIDEWEREFAWAIDKLGIEADDQAKVAAGQELLRSAMDQMQHRVLPRYDEPFFSRGKHHELANTGRVGWHPEFKQRLTNLLVERAA